MANSRKIELSYGGGSDTVLYSAKANHFFSFEKDGEKLHQIYGGKTYYTSRTGLSGAGFIQPKPQDNDLVRFGWYRTDARGQQHREIVGQREHREIFGYAPIKSHGGIQQKFPFILTDGETVAFVSRWEVAETIYTWSEIKANAVDKTFALAQIGVYDSGPHFNGITSVQWNLFNPNHLSGVDALRFVDLRNYRPEEQLWIKNPEPPATCRILNLLPITDWEGKDRWAHLHQLGVYDIVLNTMPQMIDGAVGFGDWVSDFNGILWRRDRMNVQAILELPWQYLIEKSSEYDYPGHPAWIEFEENISVLEWFQLKKSQRKARLEVGIMTKAAEMLKQHRQNLAWKEQQLSVKAALLATLSEHAELTVTFADSLAAGNCEPGTRRFCEAFGLNPDEPMTIGKLMELKVWRRMFVNQAFQRVLLHVLRNAGVSGPATFSASDEMELTDEELLGEATLTRLSRREPPASYEEVEEDEDN